MGDEWKKAFKAAFKQKEAEEAAAAAAKKKAEQEKADADEVARLANDAEVAAKADLELAKSRPKFAPRIPDRTQKLTQAQKTHETAKADVVAKGKEVEDFAAKEKAAREEKEEIARAEKRGEYSMAIKVYKRRLEAANRPNALDGHFKTLQPLYIEDKFDDLAKALKKADDELLRVVAATEAVGTQADRLKRIEALKRKPFENNNDVRLLGKQIAATAGLVNAGQLVGALTALEREITPLLASCETEADAYETLQADIEQRLLALTSAGFHKQTMVDEAVALRKKAGHQAHTGTFVEANVLLGQADAALVEAEEWADDNASDAQTYPALLLQVEKEVKDFLALHKAHKPECDQKAGGWMRSAALNVAAEAGKKDFTAAVNQLGEASAVVVGLYAKAQAIVAKQNQKAQDAAQQAAQLAAQEAAKKAAAATKLAAETVLAPSSLAAIGKNKIDKWVVQLQRLVTGPAPVCSISGGTTTFWLAGNTTVESICTVRTASGALVDTFVVHYHPAARFSDPGGSPLHAKPRRGNATTPHHYMTDGHWLVAGGHVKSFATVRSEGY